MAGVPPIHRVRAGLAAPSLVLFACMFAAQAALLVLSPILPKVAADLDVATATAAQLRAVSGLVAGGMALWLGMRSRPRPLKQLLTLGLTVLACSTAVSAVAPSFLVLASAQVGVGVALALVLSSGLAAAAEWAPDSGGRALSWALVGQPAAWIVGMPLAGAVAEISWRYAWLALPFAASLLALTAVLLRPPDHGATERSNEPSLWRHRGSRGWALGELLAYGGWAGTLVFVGALFVESYGTSTSAVGLLLAGGAVAYIPGNFLARRWVGGPSRWLLISGAVASAVGVAVFGGVRPGLVWSAGLFAALAFVAGARTFAGSSLGLRLAPQCRLQAMSVRTAAVQYGYLLGATVGGAALALGGYPGLGGALAVLYAAAAVPHLRWWLATRPGPGGDEQMPVVPVPGTVGT